MTAICGHAPQVLRAKHGATPTNQNCRLATPRKRRAQHRKWDSQGLSTMPARKCVENQKVTIVAWIPPLAEHLHEHPHLFTNKRSNGVICLFSGGLRGNVRWTPLYLVAK